MLLPGEKMVLVLQGWRARRLSGRRLCALAEAGMEPRRNRGHLPSAPSSMAPIIAGNKPEDRVTRLRESVLEGAPSPSGVASTHVRQHRFPRRPERVERHARERHSACSGFFTPAHSACDLPAAWHAMAPPATTRPSRRARRSAPLVDFDELNSGKIRYAAGAVEITSGNFIAYFDTTRQSGSMSSMSWRAARCRPAFHPS